MMISQAATPQYSSVAKATLADTIAAYKKGLSWDTADTFLARDMENILHSPDTTLREKTIATMALQAGKASGVSQMDSARIRYAAANSLTSMVGGSLGVAINGIVKQAWHDGLTWTGAAAVTEAGLRTVIENSTAGSVEVAVADATLKKTTGAGIADADGAKLRYDALNQIAGMSKAKRRWHWFKRREEPVAPPPPTEQPRLSSLITHLPGELQTRVGTITAQADTLLNGGLVPAGSQDLYHTQQIRGDFMETAVKGFLDATTGSSDAASTQKVQRNFELQLAMMKNQLDIFEKRYREEAAERVSEHTQLLAQSFGTTLP